MREIKEAGLNQSIRIEMTLKELDIVRVCLAIADGDVLESLFKEAGIKFESSEKYLLIKSCRDILESYGVLRILRKSDEA
jgi:hypothetical protein